MQLDAVADELEDLSKLYPDAAEHFVSEVPPPLPPRRMTTRVWLAVLAVALIAGGLGVGAGYLMLGGQAEATTDPATEGEASDDADEDVVRIDEVVIPHPD